MTYLASGLTSADQIVMDFKVAKINATNKSLQTATRGQLTTYSGKVNLLNLYIYLRILQSSLGLLYRSLLKAVVF